MKRVETIQSIKENKLDKYVERRKRKLEKQSKDEPLVLGFDIDYNPQPVSYKELDDSLEYEIGATTCYPNYIPKNTKMVYAMYFNATTGKVSNNGQYYYIDDDSYIKEFCEYIKGKEILSATELFDYIHDFIDEYFGLVQLDDRSREDFNHLIYKNDASYYKPIEEHKLSSLKKETKAQCTEVAVLAQNILKFLGFESYIVIGDIEFSCNDTKESHAFNLVSYKSKKSNEKVNLLVDFSSSVIVYDIDFNQIGLSPFIGELNNEPKEAIADLLDQNKGISFENYSYIVFGSKVLRWIQNVDRKYTVSFQLQPQSNVQETRKKENNHEKVYSNYNNIR